MSVFQKKVYLVHLLANEHFVQRKSNIYFPISIRSHIVHPNVLSLCAGSQRQTHSASISRYAEPTKLLYQKVPYWWVYAIVPLFTIRYVRNNSTRRQTTMKCVCVCLFHFLRMKCDNLTIQFMTWRTSFRGIFGSGMPNAYWHTVQILFPPAFWNVFLLPLWMLRTLGRQKLFSTWLMIVFF